MTSLRLFLDSIEKLKAPSSTSGTVTNSILNKMTKTLNLWMSKTKIPMKIPKINLVSKDSLDLYYRISTNKITAISNWTKSQKNNSTNSSISNT